MLDGNVVGYLLYTFGYDTDGAARFLFVIDLAVDEQTRRRGVGKALMDHAAAMCREAGGTLLFWVVHERNELALEFYRALGAEPITRAKFMTLAV